MAVMKTQIFINLKLQATDININTQKIAFREITVMAAALVKLLC